ncbi:MAG: hypothetical protein HYV45_02505 [Candidatus Moranbacteria bacterium]|nr:hypothetical protein [Candidatus Moranbacteria bacterium]
MDDWLKIFVNGATIVAWAIGIGISVVAVVKGKKMQSVIGVPLQTYLFLVAFTELVYIIGAIMILAAMGINVTQHFANLEFYRAYEILKSFDVTTIKIIGWLGWLGFFVNRSISFLSPGYLLVVGGKKLHPYFFFSAWIEIVLEIFITVFIFVSLWWK